MRPNGRRAKTRLVNSVKSGNSVKPLLTQHPERSLGALVVAQSRQMNQEATASRRSMKLSPLIWAELQLPDAILTSICAAQSAAVKIF